MHEQAVLGPPPSSIAPDLATGFVSLHQELGKLAGIAAVQDERWREELRALCGTSMTAFADMGAARVSKSGAEVPAPGPESGGFVPEISHEALPVSCATKVETEHEGRGRFFLRRLGSVACEALQMTKKVARRTAIVTSGVALAGAIAASVSTVAHEGSSGPHDISFSVNGKTPDYFVIGPGKAPVTASDRIFRHNKDINYFSPDLSQMASSTITQTLEWPAGIADTCGLGAWAIIVAGGTQLFRARREKA